MSLANNSTFRLITHSSYTIFFNIGHHLIFLLSFPNQIKKKNLKFFAICLSAIFIFTKNQHFIFHEP